MRIKTKLESVLGNPKLLKFTGLRSLNKLRLKLSRAKRMKKSILQPFASLNQTASVFSCERNTSKCLNQMLQKPYSGEPIPSPKVKSYSKKSAYFDEFKSFLDQLALKISK